LPPKGASIGTPIPGDMSMRTLSSFLRAAAAALVVLGTGASA
jgi:hypothetical protein